MNKKEISIIMTSSIISVIIAILGGILWDENKIISIITILMASILLFFLLYLAQIKTNEENIKNMREEFKKIKEKLIISERLNRLELKVFK